MIEIKKAFGAIPRGPQPSCVELTAQNRGLPQPGDVAKTCTAQFMCCREPSGAFEHEQTEPGQEFQEDSIPFMGSDSETVRPVKPANGRGVPLLSIVP